MRGKQLRMDSMIEDIDRYEMERERREKDAIKKRLDEKYTRMYEKELLEQPDGSVVIIGQNLFRNNHYTWHFYRTIKTSFENYGREKHSVFVQANNEEWPDVPPWAQVVGHEDELRDIHFFREHIHWLTGEVVEPITTWWMKKYYDM